MRLMNGSARLALAAAVLTSSTFSFAGGYEKPVMFSGRWVGVGGAAASSVTGAEALVFNPAGLAGGEGRGQVTGDFSPMIIKLSAPLGGAAKVDSKTSFVPSFGAFGSYKINEKWGLGAGVYLAGGSKAIYENVDFTNVYGSPNANLAASAATVQANVSIIEASIGTGYEILDGLRLGLGYRAVFVNAAVSSYAPASPFFQTITMDDISGTAWNGFRLGLQYYPKESRFGAGINWRTAANFTGKGNISGQVTAPAAIGALGVPAGTKLALAAGEGTASNIFPHQVDIGAHYDILPSSLQVLLQYTFTNYSVNRQLALTGAATIPGTGISQALPNIEQNWLNSHAARIGFNVYEITDWVLRAGYILSSQVTPKGNARATFVPPGMGHTFALGVGTAFLDKALETDLSLEYGRTSATIDASTPVGSDGASGLAGDYSAYSAAAHLGVSYRF
jgi:long-chain fatty acid transport protein